MKGQSVLISGIGVAGPALAHWLLRFGFRPTLVERAAALRTSGYVVDFWGAGLDVVEQMGLLPAVLAAGYRLQEVRFVDARGRRAGGFAADVFARFTGGRFTSLLRGDLSAILFSDVADRAEVVFGDTVTALEEHPDGVVAQFARGAPRTFDLVVGADGLHSAVRALVFGPEAAYERFLGYSVAAFAIPGYGRRDDDAYVLYSVPGAQVGRFALRDGRTMVLVVLAEDAPPRLAGEDARRAHLRDRLAGAGWECDALLHGLASVDELYFDRVSQIRMPAWTRGRVALIGDAAHCASLLAGQGAALAVVDAYVLAVELARASSHADAFAAYERLLMPFVLRKQDAAARFAGSFAPRSSLAIAFRNLVTRAFAVPGVARLAIGASLVDAIELPSAPAASPLPTPEANR